MSAQHNNATRPAGQDGQGPRDAALRTNQCPTMPTPTPTPPTQAHCIRDNNRKANITIATLNVNGFTAPSSSLSGIEKWTTIVRTMNKHKIAILAIQETHLDDNWLGHMTWPLLPSFYFLVPMAQPFLPFRKESRRPIRYPLPLRT